MVRTWHPAPTEDVDKTKLIFLLCWPCWLKSGSSSSHSSQQRSGQLLVSFSYCSGGWASLWISLPPPPPQGSSLQVKSKLWFWSMGNIAISILNSVYGKSYCFIIFWWLTMHRFGTDPFLVYKHSLQGNYMIWQRTDAALVAVKALVVHVLVTSESLLSIWCILLT